MTSPSPPPGPRPLGGDRAALVDAVTSGCRGLPDGAAVVVALSGGPDSTALAFLLPEARPDLAVTLVHVRHGLRDDAQDVGVVRSHADWLGLPLEVVEVTVAPDGHGPQAAARQARYAALRRVAADVGAAAIAVAHTAEDQAETVLLRLARGTGTAGLAGMAPAAGDLVRPLLTVRRADVRRFVVLEGLPTATDPTNADPTVARVAVRDRVLPALAEVGPDPVAALARAADLARDDDAALDESAAEVVAAVAVRVGDVVAVRDADLAGRPMAVTRRVWRRLVAERTGGLPPSATTVARITGVPTGARIDLPGGVVATAGGGWRALSPAGEPEAAEVALAIPGVTSWGPAGLRVVAVTPDAGERHGGVADGGQIAFALEGAWTPSIPPVDPAVVPPGGVAARCHLVAPADLGPVTVRHRAPGDRVRTPVGTRKLADAFVDAGVPRPVRERWPVLVVEGRVIWVPGVVADAEVVAAGRAAPGLLLHLAAH
ncbi:tRNA lysidine(34) synthetase TilS [Nitriliruptoraceae bacterium ZYF776]|nr:tRNA lysidine(34) synthetase TilS [Profundirhabdus halotolerans]